MKQYIKTNIVPLLIGLSVGLLFSMILTTADDLIIKIILIANEK